MTERDWLQSQDVTKLLRALAMDACPRKLRLFACACLARQYSHPPVVVRVLEAAKQFADGQITYAKLSATADQLSSIAQYPALLCVISEGISHLIGPILAHEFWAWRRDSDVDLCSLRDIFGNPFRSSAVAPAWRTQNVRDVATSIYHDNAFERLPILADALMDLGCEDETILNHCRIETHHVRGCWLVDEIMGKGWSYGA